MFSILFQPYSVRERTILKSLIHSIGEGVFIYLFLIVFQPFGVSTWHDPQKYIILIGFAGVTAFCSFVNRHYIPILFANFYKEENWVVWKEIVSILILIFFITLGNTLFGSFFFNWKLNFSFFLNSFFYVFIIAIFPTTFWVLSDYILKLKKYSQQIDVKQNNLAAPSKEIIFTAENEKDFVKIASDDLLYIESADNYSNIFIMKQNELSKILIRSSLNRLIGQVSEAHIVRTHRSFIVNLKHVRKVSGNAQGYKLHLYFNDILIPVARGYSIIIDQLKN